MEKTQPRRVAQARRRSRSDRKLQGGPRISEIGPRNSKFPQQGSHRGAEVGTRDIEKTTTGLRLHRRSKKPGARELGTRTRKNHNRAKATQEVKKTWGAGARNSDSKKPHGTRTELGPRNFHIAHSLCRHAWEILQKIAATAALREIPRRLTKFSLRENG